MFEYYYVDITIGHEGIDELNIQGLGVLKDQRSMIKKRIARHNQHGTGVVSNPKGHQKITDLSKKCTMYECKRVARKM